MVVEDPPISELREQRHDAVGALVNRHYGRIHRYLARLVDEPGLAEELAQETFLNAYLALPRLTDGSNLSAWLFRIATNLVRQQRRRQQLPCGSPRHRTWRTTSLDGAGRAGGHDAHALVDPGFEDDVVRQDLVRRALAQLPLDQRVCLLLYAWTGYTCAEIGEIVGRSTDAVRMRLVRARRRFRAAYDDDALGGLDSGTSASLGPADTGVPGGSTRRRSKVGSTGGGDVGQETGACQEVQEVLPFYPRGDLSRESFSTVTRHVTQCQPCRRALVDVQATYRLLQRHLNLAAGGDPSTAHAAILARVRSVPAANVAMMYPETAAVPLMAPVPARRLRAESPPWTRRWRE